MEWNTRALPNLSRPDAAAASPAGQAPTAAHTDREIEIDAKAGVKAETQCGIQIGAASGGTDSAQPELALAGAWQDRVALQVRRSAAQRD